MRLQSRRLHMFLDAWQSRSFADSAKQRHVTWHICINDHGHGRVFYITVNIQSVVHIVPNVFVFMFSCQVYLYSRRARRAHSWPLHQFEDAKLKYDILCTATSGM